MEGLYTKPVPLPRPNKFFYRKPTFLPRHRISMFVEDTDRFKGKEMMKNRPFTKSTRYDWLIRFIPIAIKKWSVMLRKRLWVFKIKHSRR